MGDVPILGEPDPDVDTATAPGEESGPAVRDLEALAREHESLSKRNQSRVARMGISDAAPDPVLVAMTRIEVLYDMLLGPEDRLVVEVEFERRMSKLLDRCELELGRAQLLRPGP